MTITAEELARRMGAAHPPTDEQLAAIEAPLLAQAVIAGAGSGKTQTMALRVVWLVANGLVAPHAVLGLTFTRKAAAQLGERVRRLLRQLLAADARQGFLADPVALALRTGEPTISTYSAYAASLVAEHALRLGVEPSARLIGETVSWQHAAELVDTYDGPADSMRRAPSTVTADVLALAGELAEHLRSPDDVRRLSDAVATQLAALPPAAQQRGSPLPPAVRDLQEVLANRLTLLPLVEAYTERKRERSLIDYSDQVALAAQVARDCAEVRALERQRWQAVLVDEYQDTGEAQRVLLTALFGSDVPVTAVGDPRQSIYGWRGASAGNLERFPSDFTSRGTEPAAGGGHEQGAVRELTRSFRNGERILAVANRIAAGLPARGLARHGLRAAAGIGAGQVVPALLETVDDEAAWLARTIAGLRGAVPWGEVAVLARKRSALPRLEAALRGRDVPCEVVGLGGLLLEPEVVDVVSALRVLADPTAGNALIRLLAGPRWRIGPRDLAALGARARALAVRHAPRAEAEPEADVVDERSLVEALDDLGPAAAYSPAGHARLVALRDELRELRRWTAQPLPDLVAHVARVLELDVELMSRPGARPGDALANLDRLVSVAEEFAGGEGAGLVAFLAYLRAAEEQEDALEVDRSDELAEPGAERVQLLTVHAAKGLEWDVVAVAGLTHRVFPVEGRSVTNWAKQPAALPFPLRGDRSELPELTLPTATWPGADLRMAARAVADFEERCKERGQLEERRLAYVAVTRARKLLLCTGYWWDTTSKPRGPSRFLEEIREIVAQTSDGAGGSASTMLPVPTAPWAQPPDTGAVNPLTAQAARASWPLDPLGARRPRLLEAAQLVRDAQTRLYEPGPDQQRDAQPAEPAGARAARWAQDVVLLLGEQARRQRPAGTEVTLPSRLSVSQLVQLRRDPAELARQIRRPMPAAPRPLARRGTRFHLWLEQRWGQQRLLDVDELPGAADATADPDGDLRALQIAFQASSWGRRTPSEVEFPFDMLVAGVVVRGRIDAVFTDDPDGFVDVVDWKTGAPPSEPDARASAVQLAAYRLAWSALSGTPLERIRAGLHYVATGQTVRPVDLLDAEGLADLLGSVPLAEAL